MTHRQLKNIRLLQLADIFALGLQIISLLDSSHYIFHFSCKIRIKEEKLEYTI